MITKHVSLRTAAVAASLLVTAACKTVVPNVPVRGDVNTITQLVGSWEGVYKSESTGRSGMIQFELRAGKDTAQGQVIMIAANQQDRMNITPEDPARRPMPTATLLTIRFMRAVDDQVVGLLDPYEDPNCGCMLTTRFFGRLTRDEIKGTFETRGTGIFHENTTGIWSVRRNTAPHATGTN